MSERKPLVEMTDEEIQIEIAERLGWKNGHRTCKSGEPMGIPPDVTHHHNNHCRRFPPWVWDVGRAFDLFPDLVACDLKRFPDNHKWAPGCWVFGVNRSGDYIPEVIIGTLAMTSARAVCQHYLAGKRRDNAESWFREQESPHAE